MKETNTKRKDDCALYNIYLRQAALQNLLSFSCRNCKYYKQSMIGQPNRLSRIFTFSAVDMWN